LCFNQDGSLLAAATAHHLIQLWDLRKIRRQLATMGLDWDLPPYPPPSGNDKGTEPIRITVQTPDPKDELRRQLQKWNLAIEQDSEKTELYRQRAAIYLSLGELQKAANDFGQAIQRQPKTAPNAEIAELHRQRGRLYHRMGQYSQALDDFSEAIAKQPQAADYLARSYDHQNLNQYPDAVADLKKALEIDPNLAAACNELAWVYVTGPAEVRDPDRALPLSEKAIRLTPTNGDYRNTRGVVFYRLGRFDAAVDDLQRAIQDNKGAATADDLFFLAMAYHRLGEDAKARDCYDQALRWWQDHGDLRPRQVAELTGFRAEAASLLGIRPRPQP
jgi:tetratricopeptide (TPR) repeat protein